MPPGYTRREDGDYEKTVTFSWGITRKSSATETVIRSPTGKFLRVERSDRAKAHIKRWREQKAMPEG